MDFKEIVNTQNEAYNYIETLLESAFPPEEHRPLELQREFTSNRKEFHTLLLMEGEEKVGLLTYWEFETFYYIEHFAIDSSKRNGGYGSKALGEWLHRLTQPVVLEVELPKDELSTRRIEFYQRQGFLLWARQYHQPPYRPYDNYLPMHLMVYGDLSCDKDFNEVKEKLYKEVYNVPTL